MLTVNNTVRQLQNYVINQLLLMAFEAESAVNEVLNLSLRSAASARLSLFLRNPSSNTHPKIHTTHKQANDMSSTNPSSTFPTIKLEDPGPPAAESLRIPLYDDSNHIAYGWQQMEPILDFFGMFRLKKEAEPATNVPSTPPGPAQVEKPNA